MQVLEQAGTSKLLDSMNYILRIWAKSEQIWKKKLPLRIEHESPGKHLVEIESADITAWDSPHVIHRWFSSYCTHTLRNCHCQSKILMTANMMQSALSCIGTTSYQIMNHQVSKHGDFITVSRFKTLSWRRQCHHHFSPQAVFQGRILINDILVHVLKWFVPLAWLHPWWPLQKQEPRIRVRFWGCHCEYASWLLVAVDIWLIAGGSVVQMIWICGACIKSLEHSHLNQITIPESWTRLLILGQMKTSQ